MARATRTRMSDAAHAVSRCARGGTGRKEPCTDLRDSFAAGAGRRRGARSGSAATRATSTYVPAARADRRASARYRAQGATALLRTRARSRTAASGSVRARATAASCASHRGLGSRPPQSGGDGRPERVARVRTMARTLPRARTGGPRSADSAARPRRCADTAGDGPSRRRSGRIDRRRPSCAAGVADRAGGALGAAVRRARAPSSRRRARRARARLAARSL